MLLIQNGILHTMEYEDPVHADLLIKDGKIAHIARKTGSLLRVRENSLTHVLTHTGSSRSGRGRFQWTAGGGKLPGKAPNWRLFAEIVM